MQTLIKCLSGDTIIFGISPELVVGLEVEEIKRKFEQSRITLANFIKNGSSIYIIPKIC
jgi:hypothetical protein